MIGGWSRLEDLFFIDICESNRIVGIFRRTYRSFDGEGGSGCGGSEDDLVLFRFEAAEERVPYVGYQGGHQPPMLDGIQQLSHAVESPHLPKEFQHQFHEIGRARCDI